MILDEDIQSDFNNLIFQGKLITFNKTVSIQFKIYEIGVNYMRATMLKNDHNFRMDGCLTCYLQARIFDAAGHTFNQMENNYFDENEASTLRLAEAFGHDVFDLIEFIGDSPSTDYGIWIGGYINKQYQMIMNMSRFNDLNTPQGL